MIDSGERTLNSGSKVEYFSLGWGRSEALMPGAEAKSTEPLPTIVVVVIGAAPQLLGSSSVNGSQTSNNDVSVVCQ